jgi:DNA-binding transcriptional regulator YdaS (Cro superfamily)
MAASTFTDAALRAHLDVAHSQADAAHHFGVSEPAVHQRLKRIRHLTSRVVALERAHEVVDEKLSATARLERVQVVDEELGWAVPEARSQLTKSLHHLDRSTLGDY